jgi:hypothetical protein
VAVVACAGLQRFMMTTKGDQLDELLQSGIFTADELERLKNEFSEVSNRSDPLETIPINTIESQIVGPGSGAWRRCLC